MRTHLDIAKKLEMHKQVANISIIIFSLQLTHPPPEQTAESPFSQEVCVYVNGSNDEVRAVAQHLLPSA